MSPVIAVVAFCSDAHLAAGDLAHGRKNSIELEKDSRAQLHAQTQRHTMQTTTPPFTRGIAQRGLAIVAAALLAASLVTEGAAAHDFDMSDHTKFSQGDDYTHVVAFDVTIGDKMAGRIVIGLFGNVVPKVGRPFRTCMTPFHPL